MRQKRSIKNARPTWAAAAAATIRVPNENLNTLPARKFQSRSDESLKARTYAVEFTLPPARVCARFVLAKEFSLEKSRAVYTRGGQYVGIYTHNAGGRIEKREREKRRERERGGRERNTWKLLVLNENLTAPFRRPAEIFGGQHTVSLHCALRTCIDIIHVERHEQKEEGEYYTGCRARVRK